MAQLVKNLPAMQETGFGPNGLGRTPEEGNSYPLHYSGVENSMDCTQACGGSGGHHDF